MRTFLLLLLSASALSFAQTRNRCETILPSIRSNADYDANDVIDQLAVTKMIRGEEIVIRYNDQNFSTQNMYRFENYRPESHMDTEEILFIKMVRGEQITIYKDGQWYRGVPVAGKTSQSFGRSEQDSHNRDDWNDEPCRGGRYNRH